MIKDKSSFTNHMRNLCDVRNKQLTNNIIAYRNILVDNSRRTTRRNLHCVII